MPIPENIPESLEVTVVGVQIALPLFRAQKSLLKRSPGMGMGDSLSGST